MPVVGVSTVALVIRRDTQAEMRSDSVELSAKSKRRNFGLWKSVEEQIESERAETGVHQSPMKSPSRNKNGTGNMTKIPSRVQDWQFTGSKRQRNR